MSERENRIRNAIIVKMTERGFVCPVHGTFDKCRVGCLHYPDDVVEQVESEVSSSNTLDTTQSSETIVQSQDMTQQEKQFSTTDVHSEEFRKQFLVELENSKETDLHSEVTRLRKARVNPKKLSKLQEHYEKVLACLIHHQYLANKSHLTVARIRSLVSPNIRTEVSLILTELEKEGSVTSFVLKDKIVWRLVAQVGEEYVQRMKERRNKRIDALVERKRKM